MDQRPVQENPEKQFESREEIRPVTPAIGKRRLILLSIVFFLTLFLAVNPAPVKAAWAEIERIIQLRGDPLPASPPKLSDHEIEALPSMAPQQQAQLLLERAINHYDGAIELIDKNVPSWYGHLEVQKGPLSGLLYTAINANDLRVRAASLEITLAGYDLHKSPESVDMLLTRLEDEPEHRAWLLWILGVLGNRGVETARLETVFLDRIHDPDETTRAYAVTGLGLLATDSSIAPLLEAFRDDPSPHVREGAACAIAQSGMFRDEQRLGAVPGLLKMMDDPTLDPSTRSWVFQALQDITGAGLGSNPAAWRNWWSQRSRR
jgi:HEAT repeat protein